MHRLHSDKTNTTTQNSHTKQVLQPQWDQAGLWQIENVRANIHKGHTCCTSMSYHPMNYSLPNKYEPNYKYVTFDAYIDLKRYKKKKRHANNNIWYSILKLTKSLIISWMRVRTPSMHCFAPFKVTLLELLLDRGKLMTTPPLSSAISWISWNNKQEKIFF